MKFRKNLSLYLRTLLVLNTHCQTHRREEPTIMNDHPPPPFGFSRNFCLNSDVISKSQTHRMNHFHFKPGFPRERPRRLRPRRGITLNHLIACNISNASRGGQCARLLSEQSSAFDAANRLCFNMGAHLTLKSAPGVFSRKTRLQLRYSRARLKNIVRLSVGKLPNRRSFAWQVA